MKIIIYKKGNHMSDILIYFMIFVAPFFIIGGFIKLVKQSHGRVNNSLNEDQYPGYIGSGDFTNDPAYSHMAGNVWNKD